MSSSNNFFTDKEAFRRIDLHRITFLTLSIISFIITEIGRNFYRPFIYNNNIDDFGIADSIGNSGGIIVQIFFSLAILNPPRKKVYRIILFLIIGYCIYEFLQPILPKGVFDWKDIYGTIIGGLLSSLLYFIISKFIKNKTIYNFG